MRDTYAGSAALLSNVRLWLFFAFKLVSEQRGPVMMFFRCYDAGFIAWIVIFYQKRVEWGATADYLSFNIMIGKP